jgi:predicted MFS family arabinose efflux permease
MTLCTNVGSASALTVIGLVYDWTGGYSAALVGGVLIDLLNLCVLIVLSRMNKRREISRAEQPA